MNYNVVSSDDHVQEPGDLWIKRVPGQAARPRAAARTRPEGDSWIIEGKPTMGLSLSVQAGQEIRGVQGGQEFTGKKPARVAAIRPRG